MRPSLPSGLVSGHVMTVILKSWNHIPSKRPSFEKIARELDEQRVGRRSQSGGRPVSSGPAQSTLDADTSGAQGTSSPLASTSGNAGIGSVSIPPASHLPPSLPPALAPVPQRVPQPTTESRVISVTPEEHDQIGQVRPPPFSLRLRLLTCFVYRLWEWDLIGRLCFGRISCATGMQRGQLNPFLRMHLNKCLAQSLLFYFVGNSSGTGRRKVFYRCRMRRDPKREFR